MKLINGVSSLFLIISAFNSIKTQNNLWIFANFYIIYTSFMYNTHKLDLYESFPLLDNSKIDLSDKYDIYLFNDYIAVSLLAFLNIDNSFIKNIVFACFFIDYYYNKSIAKTNFIIFFTSIINKSLTIFYTYKKYSISDEIVLSGLLNTINACFTLFIRYKYSYSREKQLLNVILTTIWHYNVINILSIVSYYMYCELTYNKNISI